MAGALGGAAVAAALVLGIPAAASSLRAEEPQATGAERVDPVSGEALAATSGAFLLMGAGTMLVAQRRRRSYPAPTTSPSGGAR
jgi:hypothetical protein